MKKIKIAHVITDIDIGGAETMLLRVLRNFDDKTYEHFVISLKTGGKIERGMENAGIRVISLNMKWHNSPLCLAKLCRIFMKEKPDIVHNYLFHAEIAGRICGKIAGVPFIVSSLRSVDVGNNFRQLLLRATDGMVSAVTAVSKRVADEHIMRRTTAKNKIRVIYNGLEIDKANELKDKNAIRRKIGIPSGAYTILSVGNLRPVKGYPFIFDAVKTLRDRGKNIKLLIVGDGDERKNLESDLANKGISDKVILAGEREDISDFLNAADVFVMASLWEGLPNSLLEAMQAGLPVVATKVGGIPEVVTDNENGILVNPKDSIGIADAIERIMNDEALCRRIGQNAKKYVKDNFDIRKTVTETEKLYEELLIVNIQNPLH